MLLDYHLHNHFSPDSDMKTAEVVSRARAKGIYDICITNHGEWFKKDGGVTGTFDYEEAVQRFNLALEEIAETRREFPDMRIGFGAEVQFEAEAMKNTEKLIKNLPFDFVLGSVHNIDGLNISGHRNAHKFFEGKSEDEAYGRYFDKLLELAQWGKFDVAAHFDVIKKTGVEFYGTFHPQKHRIRILAVLEEMKKREIGIELNTGSLHKNCKELFPHPDILKWAVEIGIEHFTLGSDAHEPKEVGRYLKGALAIAKEVGIKALSTYEKRRPTKQKI